MERGAAKGRRARARLRATPNAERRAPPCVGRPPNEQGRVVWRTECRPYWGIPEYPDTRRRGMRERLHGDRDVDSSVSRTSLRVTWRIAEQLL
jgi:hypothetical protein